MSKYEPKEIESKWRERYEEKKLFQADRDTGRKKFFLTVPVIYPNGFLHVGHLYTWTRADIYARYMRMRGYNVLFPQSWHFTGGPLVGMQLKIKNGDQKVIKDLQDSGISEKEIDDFKRSPLNIGTFFAKNLKKDLSAAGMSIDWRRTFSISNSPYFSKFVSWQFNRLRDAGLITQNTHPVIWCPREDTPLGDHDRASGEGESPEEFSVIKFKHEGMVLPAATLRPETVFGATNIWVSRKGGYKKVELEDGEKWIVSESFSNKMKYQLIKLKKVEDFDVGSLIGKRAENPVTGESIPILAEDFVDPSITTGVVMSVPMHAPFDYIGWEKVKEEDEKMYKKPKKVIEVNGEGEIIQEVIRVYGKNTSGLREATKALYKKEFNSGVMNSSADGLDGMSVKEAKLKIVDMLKEKAAYAVIYETSGEVICRCGARGVVNLLENQWFIRYSDKELKEKAIKAVENMEIFPEEARAQLLNFVYNVEDKAAARQGGLGTPLPWDKDWLIEPLSDSTLYMAYYTIAHILERLNISEVDDELFDQVFLGKEIKHKLATEVKLMRDEFEYWYPLDLRVTAKELLTNHIVFFIMNHIALLPKDKWPKRLGINGWVTMDSIKMSKSKGNTLTIRKAVEEYGADGSRLIASGSNGMDDVDWSSDNIKALYQRMELLMDVLEAKEGFGQESRLIDRYLASMKESIIERTTAEIEKMNYRNSLFNSFFQATDILKSYLEFGGRNWSEIEGFISVVLKLNHPFFPYITEELNRRMGNVTLLEEGGWPDTPRTGIDILIENEVQVLKNTVSDIRNLMKLLKITPKEVRIGISDEAAFSVYNAIVEASKNTRDIKEIRKALPAESETVKKLLKSPDKIPQSNLAFKYEFDLFTQSKEYLENTFKAKVTVEVEHEGKALPGKPSIRLS